MEGPDTVAAVFVEPVQNSGGCFPPPPGYFQRRARDLRQARRAAGLRRGHLRVRPARHDVRLRQVRLRARHDHLREGPDQRVLPHRRVPGQRPHRRAVLDRRRLLPARLHLRRAPGVGRGRDGQPRHLRARGPQPARPAERRPRSASTLEKLTDLPIVGDVRGDGYFYGIELVKDKATKETFDDDESERLLRGFLSRALFEAGLYCRADDRGDPVVQLAPPLIIGQPEFDEIEQILRDGPHRGVVAAVAGAGGAAAIARRRARPQRRSCAHTSRRDVSGRATGSTRIGVVMAYGVIHRFAGGTEDQYEATLAAVHPADGSLPSGQLYHAAGPSDSGWTIVAIHDSKESWETFRDSTLMPRLQQGVTAASPRPPTRPHSRSPTRCSA